MKNAVKEKTKGDGGEKTTINGICPKCGLVLGEVVTVKDGRKF